MNWTTEKIERYKQASDYTLFHKKLSVLAEPYLDREWSLADIGCGSGLLAMYLAPMVASIDAIDNDGVAIADLEARLDDVRFTDRMTAEKIRPRLAAMEDLEGESWDVVTLSFFGVDDTLLKTVLPLAKERALIYMHGRHDAEGPLASLDDGDKFLVADMEKYLLQNDYIYKKNVMEMQFGQPFRDIDDIHKFLMAYRVHLELSETEASRNYDVEKLISDAEEKIIQTKRFDYPYYLPKSTSVALFIIRT